MADNPNPYDLAASLECPQLQNGYYWKLIYESHTNVIMLYRDYDDITDCVSPPVEIHHTAITQVGSPFYDDTGALVANYDFDELEWRQVPCSDPDIPFPPKNQLDFSYSDIWCEDDSTWKQNSEYCIHGDGTIEEAIIDCIKCSRCKYPDECPPSETDVPFPKEEKGFTYSKPWCNDYFKCNRDDIYENHHNCIGKTNDWGSNSKGYWFSEGEIEYAYIDCTEMAKSKKNYHYYPPKYRPYYPPYSFEGRIVSHNGTGNNIPDIEFNFNPYDNPININDPYSGGKWIKDADPYNIYPPYNDFPNIEPVPNPTFPPDPDLLFPEPTPYDPEPDGAVPIKHNPWPDYNPDGEDWINYKWCKCDIVTNVNKYCKCFDKPVAKPQLQCAKHMSCNSYKRWTLTYDYRNNADNINLHSRRQ